VSPARIMVVEDEFIVAKDLRVNLQNQGYVVTSLHSTGEQAIEAAREELPDLVLMDVVLAGRFDGVQTAEQLRQELEIPVVYLTAFSDHETIQRAKATEPFAYLLKPFDARELGVAIELALYKARMQTELKQSEERYRTLMENTHEGVLVLQDGVTKYCNNRMAEISGYTVAELIEKPVMDMVHPDDLEQIEARLQSFKDGESPDRTLAFRGIAADGSERWMESNQARITWQGFTALLVFVCDITERQQLETQMLRNQKLQSLGIVAGGVAHDYNNILMGILGSSEMVLEDMDESSTMREEIQRIRDLANRAVELTRRMLDYTGKVWVTPQELDLNQVIRDCETIARAAMPRGVELKLEFEPSLPMVEGNTSQLQQVVLALISNAGEAFEGKTEGRVTVRTQSTNCDHDFLKSTYICEDQEPGDYVMLEVADNGVGIPAADRDKLFDPFFTTKFLGRGLGLAAVLGIVRAMNGAIDLDSEPGRGTSFRLYMPLASGEPE
jgi:two-component system cell cycle sensor histidine kinase/response regulator CckA